MHCRFRNCFPFDPDFNFDRQNVFINKNPDDGSVPIVPIIYNFQLLTGEDFLLLDGDNFQLLE